MLEEQTNQELLEGWRAGNQRAADVLVRRYMARLTALARSRLSARLSRRLDPEDIVLSAWRSFFVAADQQRIAVPDDGNLWPLLVTMTLHKLARQSSRHHAARRSVQSETSNPSEEAWQNAVASDPSPEQAVAVLDELESLMSRLSVLDREVVTRRLEGEPQAAIATALQCSERTVRRALQRAGQLLQAKQNATESVRHRTWRSTSVEKQNPVEQRHVQIAVSESAVSDPVPAIQPEFTDDQILLQQMIGCGGFGRVYRATLRADGMTVAVKYLRKRFWTDASAVRLLVREARIVAELTHPAIIAHSGWGESRRGAAFIVMDWVDGGNLQDWINRRKPTMDQILTCARCITEGLETAHAAGVVHADLSPGNVLRRTDGQFILTDFGYAHALSDPFRPFHGGTPGFLAPEQLSDAFGPISLRTDLYGLGGLLYWLTTGRIPTEGHSIGEILANTLSARTPVSPMKLVPEIDPGLNQLIMKCLSNEPSLRPDSIRMVMDELQNFPDFRESAMSGNPAAR